MLLPSHQRLNNHNRGQRQVEGGSRVASAGHIPRHLAFQMLPCSSHGRSAQSPYSTRFEVPRVSLARPQAPPAPGTPEGRARAGRPRAGYLAQEAAAWDALPGHPRRPARPAGRVPRQEVAFQRVRLRGAGRGDLSLPRARPQHAVCEYARRCPELTPAARHRQQAPPIN